jgi:hypothetical protein
VKSSNHSHKLIGIDRLRNVPVKARRERHFPIGGSGERCYGDRRDPCVCRALVTSPTSNQGISVLSWHPNVRQENVRALFDHRSECVSGGTHVLDVGAPRFEHQCEHLARVAFVIDDQHAWLYLLKLRVRLTSRLHHGRQHGVARQQQRETNGERRTEAFAWALGCDGAPVRMNHLAHDRQTKAEAGSRAGTLSLALPETIEDEWQQ